MPSEDQYLDAVDQLDAQNVRAVAVPNALENKYGAAIDGMSRASVEAPTIAPESAKEVFELSAKSGDPSNVVQNNVEDYRKRSVDLDLQDFMELNPAMAAWFEYDPLNKSLAQDDYEGLNILESGYKAARYVGGFAAAGPVGISTAVNAFGEQTAAMLPTEAARTVQTMFRNFRKDNEAIQGMLRGDVDELTGTQIAALSGVESAAQQAALLPIGVLMAAPKLMLNLMGAVTAGLSFGQGLDQGLDPYSNFAFGAIQGAIEKYTEFIPMSTLLGSIGLKRGLVSTLGRQLITELPTEQVATAAQDFTEWAFLPENKDKTLADYKAERAPAAYDTLVATIVSTALLGSGGHIVGRATGRAQNAQQAKTFFEGVGKNAQDSKVRERLQSKYQEVLGQLGRGVPFADVHIPVEQWNTYWAEQNGDPQEVSIEVLGDSTAYDNAASEGVDLIIPSEVYSNRIAPTKHSKFFNDILKVGPDAMSAEEGRAFLESPELPTEALPVEELVEPMTPAEEKEAGALVDAVVEGATIESALAVIGERPFTSDIAKHIKRETKKAVEKQATEGPNAPTLPTPTLDSLKRLDEIQNLLNAGVPDKAAIALRKEASSLLSSDELATIVKTNPDLLRLQAITLPDGVVEETATPVSPIEAIDKVLSDSRFVAASKKSGQKGLSKAMKSAVSKIKTLRKKIDPDFRKTVKSAKKGVLTEQTPLTAKERIAITSELENLLSSKLLQRKGSVLEDNSDIALLSINQKAVSKAAPAKAAIGRATGLSQAVALIREDVALNAAFKKAEQNARIAFRAGNSEGVATERARMREIITTARTRVRETTELTKLKKQIVKELKATKPKKQAGKPVGKFTADVQKELDTLRSAFSLTSVEARTKIDENLAQYVDAGRFPPASVAVENRVLDMVARLGARTEAGGSLALRKKFAAADLEDVLLDIQALKETGRTLTALRAFNRESKNIENREMAVDVITGGEGLPEGLETTGLQPKKLPLAELRDVGKRLLGSHYSWDTTLDVLSQKDKTSQPFKSDLSLAMNVHDQETAEKAGHMAQVDKIRAMAATAFDVTGRALVKKLQRDTRVEEIGEFTNANGARVTLSMSKAEARKLMMEYSDPTMRETIEVGMGYTEEMLGAVNATLSPQDHVFIEEQLKFYRDYYDRVNETYREFYGVDLPFNEFYSPIRREGFNESEGSFSDFLTDIQHRRGTAPNATKTRVDNIKRLKKQNDINVLERHIVEMEHFIAWADKIQELNATFKDPNVRAAIALGNTTSMLSIVDKFIADFTRGGSEFANRLNALDRIRGRMTRSVLAIKPIIMTKQLISTVAGAENMPIAHFASGTVDFWKHPIKTFRFFKKESVWFKERGNFQERDIKTALNTSEFNSFREHSGWLDMLMLNVRVGDQAAILISGWARYRWQTEVNKMPHKEAIRDFEINAERVQQSADLSQLSNFQTRGSVTKLFTQFLSSPIQYMQRETSALRNFAAGRQSFSQTAKTISIYHVIIPLLFQFMADGFEWDEDNALKAVLLGPFNGVAIVGQLLAGLAAAVAGGDVREANIPLVTPISSALYEIKTIMEDMAEGDIPIEDTMEATRKLTELTGAVTGLPLKTALDTIEGVSEGVTGGHFDDALLSVMGITPGTIERRNEE